MMSQVKIKVRPKQTVRFPALCVHCAQPATQSLPLRRRLARVTRQVDVPLCAACGQLLQRRSMDEERWVKLGWGITAVLPLLLFPVTLLLTPAAMPFAVRLLLALVVAALGGWGGWSFAQKMQQRAALPEKTAVLHAARIDTFSWRATTFAFTNDTFAERFRLLNETLLMDNI